ncbi:MAG TPA: M3 family metallopeptidase [Oligoflexia bacterium]|nr:M3 family metallopeptidase [Oligoflexia bacterium]HMR24635.1 M3 family metallopeptidase [Oligoflexia bacterium]
MKKPLFKAVLKSFLVTLVLVSPLYAANTNYAMSANQLKQYCNDAQKKVDQAIGAIINTEKQASASADKRSLEEDFNLTVKKLDDAYGLYAHKMEISYLMEAVSPNEKVRNAGTDCKEAFLNFPVEMYTNEKLYEVLSNFSARAEKREEKLKYDQKRLLNYFLNQFGKNGFGLKADKLNEFKALKAKVSEYEREYSKNYGESKVEIELKSEDLAGVSENDWLRFKQKDGTVKVTLDNNIYTAILTYADNADLREKFYRAYNTRAPENVEVLEKLIAVKQNIAKVFDAKSYADLVMELDERLAGTPDNVEKKLTSIYKQMFKPYQNYRKILQKEKCRDLENCKKSQWKKLELYPWDMGYYSNKYKERVFKIDSEKVKEYFPTEKVVEGTFEIYAQLFSMRFEPMKNPKVWHEDVRAYHAYDAKTGDLLGNIYLDLYSRDNKPYKHYAAFNIDIRHQPLSGEKIVPDAVMVTNFTPPTRNKKGEIELPSLSTHGDVETYFHEFGHIMDDLLSNTKHYHLSKMTRPLDIVEGFSQMLEPWVWDAETLEVISGHYKTGEKLPKELLDKMKKGKYFSLPAFYVGQIHYALVDMAYHKATEPVDTTKIWNEKFKEIFKREPVEGLFCQASFGHLASSSYNAGYYGYIWSEIYAMDMLTRFKKEGMLNPKTGMDYRKLLESGHERPIVELIEVFLNRPFSEKAFLKSLKNK